MLLSIQQKYILEVLRKLSCIRRRQLLVLMRSKFPEINVSDRSIDAMLRQLRGGMGNVRTDAEFVRLSGSTPDYRRLEAVDVMLELSEHRLEDFSTNCSAPKLLRFSLEGVSLRLFTVATLSNPLYGLEATHDSLGRIIWISDNGEAPLGMMLPPKHFFAARQPDGSHRFYGSE